MKEQRATPPRSDCVWAIALPPAAGVQTNSPCVRARPLSLRVILAETLKCAPCTACAGVAVAFPITGLTAAGFALLAIGANTASAASAVSANVTLEIVRALMCMERPPACLPAVEWI